MFGEAKSQSYVNCYKSHNKELTIMDDKNTKYYIFGLLSGLLFIPLIDELSNVIAAWIQVLILLQEDIVLFRVV